MRTLPILLLTLSVILAGCWGEARDKSSREAAFEEVMGFAPAADVTKIESSWYFVKDTYVRWLSFSCDDATLAKIKSLKATKEPKYLDASDAPGNPERNPNAPDWWRKAPVPAAFEAMEIDRTDPAKSIDTEIIKIWIDRKARKVYASRSSWH